MPLNQKSNKGITIVTGIIDPSYQGEIEPLLHTRYKLTMSDI
jgi:dUTPase